MTKTRETIPEATLETLARTFFKEAYGYGFRKVDYLRFVNLLLDVFMKTHTDSQRPLMNNERMEDIATTVSDVQLLRLPLYAKRIRIREFSAKYDPPLFKRWLSDDHGRYFLLSCSTARAIAFEDLIEDESTIIGVVTLYDDTPIGSVAFLDHDHFQRKAEVRGVVGESAMRGKGLAEEATRLWIQYGFRTLGLRKIYLNTLDTNIRNIKLNEELGFRVEGILRNDVFFDGKHHDVLRMGLLNE